MKVPSTVPEYLLDEVQQICVEWPFLIENCKRCLSIIVRLLPRILVTVEFSRQKANQIAAIEPRNT